MIKTTIKVPALGIEIDGSKVDSIEIDREYDDMRSDYYCGPVGRALRRSSIVFRFKGGGTLDLSNVEFTDHLYSMERVVDFELGAHYIVNDGKNKWVAVCIQFDLFEGKKLVAVSGYAQEIYQDDKGRFDYEYEEFLPGEKVRKLL